MKTTAREYWKEKFGEYPQNDDEKLACAMMAEYAWEKQKEYRKSIIEAVQKLEFR